MKYIRILEKTRDHLEHRREVYADLIDDAAAAGNIYPYRDNMRLYKAYCAVITDLNNDIAINAKLEGAAAWKN